MTAVRERDRETETETETDTEREGERQTDKQTDRQRMVYSYVGYAAICPCVGSILICTTHPVCTNQSHFASKPPPISTAAYGNSC